MTHMDDMTQATVRAHVEWLTSLAKPRPDRTQRKTKRDRRHRR